MDSLASINQALEVVGARNGIEGFLLNAEGVCSFGYRGTEIQLEYLSSAEVLQVCAPLVSIEAVADGDGERGLYRMLLSLNLSHPDLLGTNFAIHSGESLVVLQDRITAGQCSAGNLEERLSTFLWLVEIWTRRLLEFRSLEELRHSVSRIEADEIELDLLGNAGIEPPATPHFPSGIDRRFA